MKQEVMGSGQMLFLTPNQQCQSADDVKKV